MRCRGSDRAPAVVVALLLVGCGAPPPIGEEVVDLTIVADDSVVDAKLAVVSELDLALSGAETKAQPYPLARPLARTERVVIRPSVSGGTLTITAGALDGSHATIASGATKVALVPGTAVMATLTLSAPPPNPVKLELLAGALGGAGAFDATGATARFWAPGNLVLDGAGYLFIADSNNGTIRKLAIATGAVTTVAGAPGLPGDVDGAGTDARIYAPRGIALDAAGNLYVAEYGSSCIRKVTPATGDVVTWAGKCGAGGTLDGVGKAARFSSPHGLVVEGTSLYVADTSNCTVRAIDLASTNVTTLAGGPGLCGTVDAVGNAARFDQPFGITSDGQGTLYVSDSNSNVIRKVVIAGAKVTSVAGMALMSGSTDGVGSDARFADPTDVTLDGAGNLYVADAGNYAIRQIVLATATVSTLGGGRNGEIGGSLVVARFSMPRGIACDRKANALYVTDFSGHTLRRIDLGPKMVSTVAGMPVSAGNADGIGPGARFNGPVGPAADASGHLFFADSGNDTIRQIDVATGTVTTLAGTPSGPGSTDGVGAAARFRNPSGVAWDSAGLLYVVDTGNDEIRQVEIATGKVTTLAGSPGGGNVDGVGAAAAFRAPQGLVYDDAGTIYVIDTNNNSIRKLDVASRTVSTFAGSVGGFVDGIGKAARFYGPMGGALDGKGHLWVADTQNHLIRMVELATGKVTSADGADGLPESVDGAGAAARLNGPTAIALLPTGNLIVADTGNHTLRLLDPTTQNLTTVVGVPREGIVEPGPLPAHLSMPNGVTALSDGRVAITSAAEWAILAVTLP